MQMKWKIITLNERTKRFALKIIELIESLPKKRTADFIGKQLLEAGTSVGANYRLLVERGHVPILFLKWVLLKKKLMRRSIGWNYSSSLTLFKRTIYLKKQIKS